MDGENDNSGRLYYSIGEVADMLGVNESLLRFWEKTFDIITPRKTDKGTRFYRKEDIENIRMIYFLVKEKGMTLAGAKKKLKENRESVIRNFDIIERLQAIRAEIIAIRDELE